MIQCSQKVRSVCPYRKTCGGGVYKEGSACDKFAESLQNKKAHKPGIGPITREQVEKVFPGCPACKNGPPKIHIPAFRAMAVCNQHMDHEAFDIELNSKFCLNCGRPLTDEAVDMVMDRLKAMQDEAETD